MSNFRKFLIDLIIKSSGNEKLTHSLIPALLIGGLFGSNLTLSQMLPDGTNQKHNMIFYTLLGIAIGALIYYLYNNYYSIFATKYENHFRPKKNDREGNN